jgi:hypothetical protein
MQNSSRKQFSQTSFFLSFEGIFPLQFVTCIPTRFLFLFLQFEILRIKEALRHSYMLHAIWKFGPPEDFVQGPPLETTN